FARDIAQAASTDTVESKLKLTPQRMRNVAYFRDFVLPELAMVNREDGNSCFSCHGGGKVPSLVLVAPDRRTGYLSAKDVWTNYRTLLERIDFNHVESSKLLRKPLNIQT